MGPELLESAMNRATTAARVSIVVAVLSLAACTTNGGTSSVKSYSPQGGEVDLQKVAYVEAKASRRNVHVHWINPPRVAKKD